MECEVCGASEDLIKIRNEQGQIIQLCQNCYESEYERYEKVEGGELEEEDSEEDGSEKEGDFDEDAEDEKPEDEL